jgi:hypothetical protein
MYPCILNTVDLAVAYLAVTICVWYGETLNVASPALTAALYLAAAQRFLLHWPMSSPNIGGAIDLGGTALGLASGLGERLSRGRSGVRMGR